MRLLFIRPSRYSPSIFGHDKTLKYGFPVINNEPASISNSVKTSRVKDTRPLLPNGLVPQYTLETFGRRITLLLVRP